MLHLTFVSGCIGWQAALDELLTCPLPAMQLQPAGQPDSCMKFTVLPWHLKLKFTTSAVKVTWYTSCFVCFIHYHLHRATHYVYAHACNLACRNRGLTGTYWPTAAATQQTDINWAHSSKAHTPGANISEACREIQPATWCKHNDSKVSHFSTKAEVMLHRPKILQAATASFFD